MILCVTPNPAIDRTMIVQDFARGGIFRPQQVLAAAGGKGINVARAAQILGADAVCAGFLGGFSGQYVESQVRAEGMPSCWTWLDNGETRTCMILVDPDTLLTTVVNEPGPLTTASDWQRLRADVLNAAASSTSGMSSTSDTLIAFSGSLPPGTPLELYISIVQELAAAGKQVWVDTSGPALDAIAGITRTGGTQRIGIKVNDAEISALVGMPVDHPADAAAAGRMICDRTGGSVVITQGAKGAVLVTPTETWRAILPEIRIKSAVGSGDAFLAGMLSGIENGGSLPVILRRAAAAGTANALSVGGGQFTRTEFEAMLNEIQIIEM